MWLWILGGVSVAVAGICLRQYRANHGIYRPHATRQPARREREVPLGMEATDLAHVRATMRRNESLERANTNWTNRRSGGYVQAADTDIDPLSDDETYAARYHAAFHKKNSKD